jgi:tetratricopeptide (TPR) repeat protein
MRIYVSSTSDDLRDYRAQVVKQLRGLNHDVVSMDGYTADARSPVEKCLADVASADAYIGLFAFHYGSIPEGYDASITELEFKRAGELSLPRLVFLVPDDVDVWPPRYVDRGTPGESMNSLRQTLLRQEGFTVAFFHDQVSLLTQLPKAVQDHLTARSGTIPARAASGAYKQLLKPLTYETERSKHLARFTGREWVGRKLDDWLVNWRDSRAFCLIGGPGIGKSAIACHWYATRDDVVGFHHCVFGHEEKTNPKRILVSLAAQLAERLPSYAQRLSALSESELRDILKADARTVFDNLFLRPTSGGFPAPDGVRLVVIDALDEASRDTVNELAEILGEAWIALPGWLRLVVTCRPEMDVSAYLNNLRPFIIDAGSRENLGDIRSFLRRELSPDEASDEVVNRLVEKSEGMFLYATLVLEEVRARRLSLDRIADFPEGLTGYYKNWFARKFPVVLYQNQMHTLVSVVIAQRAPLPISVLADALGLSLFEVRQRLMSLGVLFPIRAEAHRQDGGSVTMMHKSLHDWLTDINPVTQYPRAGTFAADKALGTRLLAEAGWRVYQRRALTQHSYFSVALLGHLVDAQQTERLTTLLLDPELITTVWSKERSDDWQRHIGGLSRTRPLAILLRQWLSEHRPQAGPSFAVSVSVLCRMFEAIGAFDDAIVLAEAALEIWSVHSITDSPEMVDALLCLGHISAKRDELERATGHFEKALSIAKRAYAADSSEMAGVHYALCVFYTKGKRDYEKASDCLESALNIWRRASPPDLLGMASCINDRSVILTGQGIATDYMSNYREALALFEKACPNGHSEMVATLSNIANEQIKQGSTGEAVETLRRAIALSERILLPQHEYRIMVQASLSGLLTSMGRYDEALKVMQDHVAGLERYPGPDHEETARAQVRLCSTLLDIIQVSDEKRGMPRDELRKQCRRVRQAPPGAVLSLLALSDRARRIAEPLMQDCLSETARLACAEFATRSNATSYELASADCFRSILEVALSDRPLGELAPRIVDVWRNSEPKLTGHADWLAKTRKLVVALIAFCGRTRLDCTGDITHVQDAFNLVSELGAESPDTLDVLATLAVSLHHKRHDAISESLSKQLLAKAEQLLGRNHGQTLVYLSNLGVLTIYRHEYKEAEHLFREALRRYEHSKGKAHSGTLSAAASVIECLLLQGDREQAHALVQQVATQLPADTSFTSARKAFARYLSTLGMRLKNELSEFKASREAYRFALEIDPNNPTTHNNMAMLLWVCLGELASAKEHFERGLQLDPPDGTTESNYAHLLGQCLGDPDNACKHFEHALALSPHEGAIAGNYAMLLVQQGELDHAREQAVRSMRLCLSHPNRIMLRPLFCAAAIMLLRGGDAAVPLGQIKTLLAKGIDFVPWVVSGTLESLSRRLPPEQGQLMQRIVDAISDHKNMAALETDAQWQRVVPVQLTHAWPE